MAGEDVSENLVSNGNFELGTVGKMPERWHWQIFPKPEAKAELVEDSAAGRCLRIVAAFNEEKPRDNYPIVVGEDLELPLGRGYRLKARMKAAHADAKAKLMMQSYVAHAYFWASSPQDVKVGTEWQDVEFTFKTPGVGERGHHEKMKTFRVRIDYPTRTGRCSSTTSASPRSSCWTNGSRGRLRAWTAIRLSPIRCCGRGERRLSFAAELAGAEAWLQADSG